nr:MAG TPA: TATA-box binding protein [Caudoviricetes sp.]
MLFYIYIINEVINGSKLDLFFICSDFNVCGKFLPYI